MGPSASPKRGRKRTRSGHPKLHQDMQPSNQTPTCAQPLPSDSEPTSTCTGPSTLTPKDPYPTQAPVKPASNSNQTSNPKAKPSHKPSTPINPQHHSKRPRLPKNTTIHKRPLPHPPIPTPYTSSAAQIIYITRTTPFIPTVKRIRKLLSHGESRAAQSESQLSKKSRNLGSLNSNARLSNRTVERAIAESSSRGVQGKGGRGKESVYVKASGRAIPRALEVGNWFQGQADCAVSVQMGSVAAIDDIEVDDVVGSEKGKEGDEDVDMVDADATGEERDADRKRDTSGERSKQRGHDEHVEEIPESRIRTLSTVAVSIRLK